MNSTESAYERLIAALEATGNAVDANGSSASAECPVPDHGRGRGDQHPSLRLTDAAGKVLIHCFAGCDTADVLAALNLTETDLFNAKGGIDYIYNGGRTVRRRPGKKFVQSGNTQDNSLFQVEDIGDAETVYVVEGEQDAANVAKVYGVAAISPPCGAKTAASKWNWEPLTGKHVVIVADKDKNETGSKHADDVAAQLHNAASVRIVESAVGKDISDHIAAGKTLEDLVVTRSLLDKLSVTSEWLEAQEFPDLEEIVAGIVVEGVTVLAGPPKVGKSFLVGNLATAVVSGGKALGYIAVEKRPVLVLALEDGHRRLQHRYREIFGGPIPPGITFITKATPAECVSVIAEYLHRNDKPMIILDTLGKVKQAKRAGEESYTVDYELGGKFKALADSRPGCAIVIIHHTRKADATDFVDLVSGTHGIAGSVDSILTVDRKRREAEATLSVTGRDVTENEYALTVVDGFRWQLDGMNLAGAAARADERRDQASELTRLRKLGTKAQELAKLIEVRGHLTPTEAAFKFDMTPKRASEVLGRLVDADFIVKAGYGEYQSKRYSASIRGAESEDGQEGSDTGESLSPGTTAQSAQSSLFTHSAHSADVVELRPRNTCLCGAKLEKELSISRGICAECWSEGRRGSESEGWTQA